MHLRKLFVVASAGLCFALGAMAQTDAGAPSSQEGSAKKSKSSKKRSTRKSSKSSKSSSSKSSKKGKKRKASPPAAAAQQTPPATFLELPVADDGEAPQLTHEAAAPGLRGKPLPIAAHAADANGVYGPILYVRKQGLGAGDYVPIRMVASKIVPGDYAVEVPAGLTNVEGLEYYIEAWDMAGNGPARVGSAEAPLLARLDEEKKAVAPPTTVMIK
ncbi:MAG: hypothetical protein ACXWLR_12285, partial [Myxococcales bacterium]